MVLLDAFNAADPVSNWVTAGHAMSSLAGKGMSVAAPAGGAWSLYTNWEQDGSRQWKRFWPVNYLIGWSRTRALHPVGTRSRALRKGGPERWRWQRFTPSAIATQHRCRVSSPSPRR